MYLSRRCGLDAADHATSPLRARDASKLALLECCQKMCMCIGGTSELSLHGKRFLSLRSPEAV